MDDDKRFLRDPKCAQRIRFGDRTKDVVLAGKCCSAHVLPLGVIHLSRRQ